MAFRVLKPGLWTTVQDRGRIGWQRYGVSVGGPMDEGAFRLANLLVGNDDVAAGLEMTLTGGVFQAMADTVIAVCGADMDPSIDGERLPMGRPVPVKAGAMFRFGNALTGRYTYIAIAGGIDVPKVLGSRASSVGTGFPGLAGRVVAAGDVLPYRVASTCGERAPRWFVRNGEAAPPIDGSGGLVIRAMRGREWPLFSAASRAEVESGSWVCTVRPESNRMGYRMESQPLSLAIRGGEMLSEAVTAGTVQVPPDGRPIVLMADRQTTGGYPRLLQVLAVDLGSLAQARPGERLQFQLVSAEEALEAFRERERRLAWLRERLRWANR
jgi:antagonist of KipI